MKGHKAHHHGKHAAHKGHFAEGGHVGEHMEGVPEYKEDLARHNMSYTGENNVGPEAEAKKRGGRAKRKHGGHVMHHHMGHVKHIGAVHGAAAHQHAGRKPRKAGGRAKSGSDSSPLSSAHKGTNPHGHKDMDID
jgi:hypothetical protein